MRRAKSPSTARQSERSADRLAEALPTARAHLCRAKCRTPRASGNMTTALSIRGVRKVFGKNTVILDDIDLEVAAGEFVILVGSSGCGKSTLLNMIAGLDMPTAGSIAIGGRDVTHVPSKDRDIAMVFQSYA